MDMVRNRAVPDKILLNNTIILISQFDIVLTLSRPAWLIFDEVLLKGAIYIIMELSP